MKTNNLISSSLKIFGGSAVAGMGFALGRDVYKRLKKWYLLIIALVLIFTLYTSGIWIARNYDTILKSIFIRIGAILVGIPSFIILYFFSLFFFSPSTTEQTAQSETAYLLYATSLPILVLLVGVIVGFLQRKKRSQIWYAEQFNLDFMKSTGLIEHEDGTIEDIENSVNYKIDFIGKERVTLMPIGKRNKRAYIYLDPFGKYSEFSGLIAI